jgi:hypothetical protein
MRAGLLLGIALAVCGQNPPDPTDVLVHARDKMVERANRSPNYTCMLLVDRKYFQPSDPLTARSCDQVIGLTHRGKDTGKLQETERVRLDVKVSGGREIASWPGARQFDSQDILDLARGNFEAGTFGPVLQDIFLNEGAEFQYAGEKSTDGSTVFEYMFQVPGIVSHLYFRVQRTWLTNLAYEGSIEIDTKSFDLKSLTVRNDNLPQVTQICLATDTANYEQMQIGPSDFLLPRESVLRALYSDSGTTETRLKYSNCHEYRTESTIDFSGRQPATISEASKNSTTPSAALPSGLAFSIGLADPIDTDNAAAGDAIRARLRHPVLDPASKSVLAPAGAIIHGRIVRMQHFLGTSFRIAVQLETIEIGGVEVPLYAKPNSVRTALNVAGSNDSTSLRVQGHIIVLPPLGESSNSAAFLFGTSKDRYIVPAGYESNWITAPAPAKQ